MDNHVKDAKWAMGLAEKHSYQVKRKIKKKRLDELPDCEMTEGLAPRKEVSYI